MTSIVESLPWSAALVDRESTIVAVSEPWRQFSLANGGDPAAMSEGVSYLGACPDDDPIGRLVAAGLREVLADERNDFTVEYPCHGPHDLRWFRVHISSVGDGRALVVHLPITEEVRTRLAAGTRTVGVIELDAALEARFTDSRWNAFRGVSADEDLGDRWWAAVHPADRAGLLGSLRSLVEGDLHGGTTRAPSVCDVRLVGADEVVPVRIEASVHLGDGAVAGILMAVSLTDARHGPVPDHEGVDPLTGLANRNTLNQQLDLALARDLRNGTRTAVMFLDLDRFKPVNDAHGHHLGDSLLVSVAGRLRQCVRPTDLLVRHGGDEFVIVLADLVDLRAPEEIGTRIVSELSKPYEVSGGLRIDHIGASIGVAVANATDTPGQLVRRADAAMYQAKAAGRGTLVFAAGDSDAVDERMDVTAERLESAWSAGQFEMHYQPIFDLESGRISGVEALLRWRHPELGVLPAGAFIDIAHAAEMMADIGWWAVERALAEFPRHTGLDLFVNFSRPQFGDRARITSLVERLRGDRDVAHVVVEVTEQLLANEGSRVRDAIVALRGAGVRIAIDDFGSGYSSFSRLRYFPSDILKLDAALVHGVDCDARARRILEGVVALAESLSLRLVVEGIEHPAEFAVIRRLGARYAQGRLLHGSVPADEIRADLRVDLDAVTRR